MMVPLRIQASDWVRKADDAPHRSTAFRHATLHSRPGLWGDDPWHPTSAVWLRDGDAGTWEAFGAGRPSPAIGWLASRAGGRPIALLAPPSWEGPIRMLGGRVEAGMIQTRLRPDSMEMPTRADRVEVRRLTIDDGAAFEAVAPPWALRSWGDFPSLITQGAAFGVPMISGGVASLAWTYESDLEHDKIGVATRPRYRKLGLGAAAASTLVDHIVRARRKSPLWVTTPDNPASIALAASLGFSTLVEEKLLRWTPANHDPSDL
jgi:RimJ/RimL family protein N-acetyltransferase